jgi:uncharacterized protein YbaR (Trm112 family)
MALLKREAGGVLQNSEEMIELAYDIQAGSYVAAMEARRVAKRKAAYSAEIVRVILALSDASSIMEAGVGEATTFSSVIWGLRKKTVARGYAFDLSWSRVAYAKKWLSQNSIDDATLCTGSLFHIPFADNSIDIVYTSHSIEPNGGLEEPILRELHRVARKYLVLLEPDYESATEKGKKRMESHGYCRNLLGAFKKLRLQILDHHLFPFSANPLNPTAITIIQKKGHNAAARHIFACPRLKTPLLEIGGMMFSPEALVVYPIVGGIPCLRIENGIVASRFPDLLRAPCR